MKEVSASPRSGFGALHHHAFAGLVLVAPFVMALVMSLTVVIRHADRPGHAGDASPAWGGDVELIHRALVEGRISLAAFTWQDAYAAALASGKWPGLLAVGDVALAIGDASGSRVGWTGKARVCYFTALLRARRQASLDGVLSATEAFVALGDSEGAARGLAVAWQLAREPTSRARVHEFARRVDQHAFATAEGGGGRF